MKEFVQNGQFAKKIPSVVVRVLQKPRIIFRKRIHELGGEPRERLHRLAWLPIHEGLVGPEAKTGGERRVHEDRGVAFHPVKFLL